MALKQAVLTAELESLLV